MPSIFSVSVRSNVCMKKHIIMLLLFPGFSEAETGVKELLPFR